LEDSFYALSYKSNDKFYNGVTFEKIYALYDFDKRLRSSVMDMFENIEIAMRAHITYTHCNKYGSLGYKDCKNFHNPKFHKSFIKLFRNLIPEDKKHIADTYYNGIPYPYIQNWLQALTTIRNSCAHYGRLYNKDCIIPLQLSKNDKKIILNNRKIFANIFAMKKLCPAKTLWNTFFQDIQALIFQYEEDIKLELIGFPKNWEKILK